MVLAGVKRKQLKANPQIQARQWGEIPVTTMSMSKMEIRNIHFFHNHAVFYI